MTYSTLLLGAFLLFPSPQGKAQAGQDSATTNATVVRQQLPSYPLETCPVSGEKLDDGAKNIVVEGMLVRVCCGMCVKPVKAAPKKFVKMIEEAAVAQQKSSYPLDTCIISGEPLGDTPHDFVHGTRLVRTCCESCAGDFEEHPAKYMAKIDAALIHSQIADYPAKSCPVSGKALGAMGDPIDRLYGTKLVRLCCKGCVKPFEKNPAKFAAEVYGSAKTKPSSRPVKKPTSRGTR